MSLPSLKPRRRNSATRGFHMHVSGGFGGEVRSRSLHEPALLAFRRDGRDPLLPRRSAVEFFWPAGIGVEISRVMRLTRVLKSRSLSVLAMRPRIL